MITSGIGITLAFVAMLSWGFGDFLIQKSTRKVGDWETLFFISFFGFIILIPFVWHSLPNLFFSDLKTLGVLVFASVILLLAAILDFEALKKGKLSVIEPIWSIEIPAAAFAAFIILGEKISFSQIILISILMISLITLSFREKKFSKKLFFEKAVLYGIIGGIMMGAANFFMGWGARITDPILINFFTDAFLLIVSGIFILSRRKGQLLFSDFKNNFRLLLPMSIADKIAWLAFVFSMTLAPIAITTALSESYIIVTVILGLFVNKEKLLKHQKIGLMGAIITALILAIITTY